MEKKREPRLQLNVWVSVAVADRIDDLSRLNRMSKQEVMRVLLDLGLQAFPEEK